MIFHKPNVFFASFYLAFYHLKKSLPKSGLILMFIPIWKAFKMTAYALIIALGMNPITGESFEFYILLSMLHLYFIRLYSNNY